MSGFFSPSLPQNGHMNTSFSRTKITLLGLLGIVAIGSSIAFFWALYIAAQLTFQPEKVEARATAFEAKIEMRTDISNRGELVTNFFYRDGFGEYRLNGGLTTMPQYRLLMAMANSGERVVGLRRLDHYGTLIRVYRKNEEQVYGMATEPFWAIAIVFGIQLGASVFWLVFWLTKEFSARKNNGR